MVLGVDGNVVARLVADTCLGGVEDKQNGGATVREGGRGGGREGQCGIASLWVVHMYSVVTHTQKVNTLQLHVLGPMVIIIIIKICICN